MQTIKAEFYGNFYKARDRIRRLHENFRLFIAIFIYYEKCRVLRYYNAIIKYPLQYYIVNRD